MGHTYVLVYYTCVCEILGYKYIHVLMRNERRKEERSKQGQTNKAKQHPRQSLFLIKMSCLGWHVEATHGCDCDVACLKVFNMRICPCPYVQGWVVGGSSKVTHINQYGNTLII